MLLRGFLYFSFSIVLLSALFADTLAIERFEPAVGTLHETSGGYGWFSNWFNQGEYTGLDGWVIDDSNPMDYPEVTEAGNYCSGGDDFTTTGRHFDVTGSFSDYEVDGRIGAGSFYFSFLIRKEADDDDVIEVIFSDEGIDPSALGDELIKMGYFGGDSNSGGSRYWSLSVDNDASISLSNTEITVNETYRIVVEIVFGTTTNVNMWVNPPIDQLPAVPDASVSSTGDLGFWKIILLFGGELTNHGSFDEFIFTDDLGNVLPVEYTEFYANPVSQGIQLHWTTATEITNDRFVIERLNEDQEWEPIGEIDGNGDSSEMISYSFLDKSPPHGTNFYRLVQVDFDGQRHISKTVSASFQKSLNIDVSIHQKGGELHFISNSKIREISISDLAGKDVHQHFVNQKEFSIALGRREKSIYLVVVKSTNGVWRQKILIQ
ncbi:MAG: T9SS type A sorting domain-containing protein [Cyclobacteriaceae bacterium]